MLQPDDVEKWIQLGLRYSVLASVAVFLGILWHIGPEQAEKWVSLIMKYPIFWVLAVLLCLIAGLWKYIRLEKTSNFIILMIIVCWGLVNWSIPHIYGKESAFSVYIMTGFNFTCLFGVHYWRSRRELS